MPIGPLMADIAGLTLTAEDRELLSHPVVGGIILFARNYSSPQQLANLTAEIHQLRDPPLLIAVDQEGGRVQRFRDNFTILPPAAKYGELYQQQSVQALHLCELGGWLMATELRSVGVDFSFAPVLDLGLGPSQVIGNRAFASTPQAVTELTLAWMRGVKSAGMPVVGKHFPGHGSVQADSHLELPVDNRPLAAIMEADLVPFANLIKAGLNAIMPAHVLYAQVDPRPAGFSPYWLKEVLRTQLGFQGVVFSDDLSMGAAQTAGGYGSRANVALEAGCDMVLACNNRQGAIEVTQALTGYDNIETQLRFLQMQPQPFPGLTWESMHTESRWREAVEAITAILKITS